MRLPIWRAGSWRRPWWSRIGARRGADGRTDCGVAPLSPGCLRFARCDGRPLYVGKAVNLRRRLRAHFRGASGAGSRPTSRACECGMGESGIGAGGAAGEAELIHELEPRVNVQIGPPGRRRADIPPPYSATSSWSSPRSSPIRPSWSRHASTAAGCFSAHAGTAPIWPSMRRASPLLHVAAAIDVRRRGLAPIVFSWLAGRGARIAHRSARARVGACELRARIGGAAGRRATVYRTDRGA